jgi:hypothetical protein
MSRYLILLLLNTPFIIAGLVNALVSYKLSKISKRRFMFQFVVCLVVFIGLASAKPIYEFLFSNNLTHTEPLSLFDVIQITGIIAIIFVAQRTRAKLETLERRVQDLHQELSIKLSEESQAPPKPAKR